MDGAKVRREHGVGYGWFIERLGQVVLGNGLVFILLFYVQHVRINRTYLLHVHGVDVVQEIIQDLCEIRPGLATTFRKNKRNGSPGVKSLISDIASSSLNKSMSIPFRE